MSELDFTFGFEGASGPGGPWAHLLVVSVRGREEMSALYRYQLTLLARAPAPELEPFELVGKRATLRIRTLSTPEHHVVHGIVAEAEEINSVPDGMLYRVDLVPPLARALYRKRCRIFLQKTTRQILDAVLEGDPYLSRVDGAAAAPDSGDCSSFTPAAEQYTWRVTSSPRIDQPGARPYCVQYNESDLAFLSRLLEAEGISYHFENGAETCLLVLSDEDAGRTAAAAAMGPGAPGRELSALRLGGRLRPKSVSLDDYNWHQPTLPMLARAGSGDAGEYTYPGGYPDTPAQGEPLASVLVDRYAVEASYAAGEGRCRTLAAGMIVPVEHPRASHEGDYLITKLEVRGEQGGVSQHIPLTADHVPFRCTFEAARCQAGGSRFRPAKVTPRPRIQGSQTAFVTSAPEAPGATVHVGDVVGCVRLKFHWDHDEERLAREPSSCWVRVSQAFAGGGEGSVWHPRVGVEVIVEFLEGDPDRPIVTGRVYNGEKTPPAPSVGSPTISTIKTLSVPGGGQYNELLFDDGAGAEQIKMHAAKDWNTVVENDRTELAKNNSTSTIGVNRTESTGANRSTAVGANNSEMVGANESLIVGASQSHTIGANQRVVVGANQTTEIQGRQKVTITGDQDIGVTTGHQTLRIPAGHQHFIIQGKQDFDITGNIEYASEADVGISGKIDMSLSAGEILHVRAQEHRYKAVGGPEGIGFGCKTFSVDASESVTVKAGTKQGLDAPTFTIGGVTITISGDTVSVEGTTSVKVTGGSELLLSGGGSTVKLSAAGVEVNGSDVQIAGGSVEITGDVVTIN
ncbi:MAG: type VI secretion system tip protein VgrG [Polyangiaceae bacterium]|nr:type VI secretion system tip protein VgrG [Polyangiaceae bacterium]